MTDTTAPRTAAAELHDAIDALETVSVEWAPAHSAPFVSKYVVLPIVDIYAQRIEAEAIEPLLALVRRFLDARQALMDYRGGSDEHYLDQLGRELIHAEAELRAALPESVRVAARKP